MPAQLFLSLYFVLKLIAGPPIDISVDSTHALPDWYAPGENPIARQALDELVAAAEDDGLNVAVVSSYRRFDYQARVYGREARKWPARVDNFIARPGHSEHQLGTAFDLAWPGLPVQSQDPRNIDLYEWIQNNAHRFGFVVSYPLKYSETWPYSNRWKPIGEEFMYEPWHIRYVGLDLAAEMLAAGYLDPDGEVYPRDFYKIWP